MILGRVIGSVVCSIKNPMYEGQKLLFVKPLDAAGQAAGTSFLAVDAVQAGIGDRVLVIDEGGSARQILDKPVMGTIRTVIAGIVDSVALENHNEH